MISRYQEDSGVGRGRFDGLMSLRDAAVEWELDESTVRKAISSGRFVVGVDAQKFGKQWIVTAEAMAREFDWRRTCRHSLEVESERFAKRQLDLNGCSI